MMQAEPNLTGNAPVQPGPENPPRSGVSLCLSRFTSDSGILTKTMSLDSEGRLVKNTSANLTSGRVETLELESFDDFAEVLMGLQHAQALAYGVSLRGEVPILSEKLWETRGQPVGVIRRNREHFDWPDGGGVLMLDYDPPKDSEPLSRDALLASLCGVLPELREAVHLWWPSASSCICNSETSEHLTGIKGQRVYIWVADARDICRAGDILAKRLWLAGFGRYDISKGGSLLERTIIDGGVFQPERLDFAAGAKCKSPLTQNRGAPQRFGGAEPLDTLAALQDLNEDDEGKLLRLKAKAKAAKEPEAASIKEAWIEARGGVIASSRGIDLDKAKAVARAAVESEKLMGDFVLTSQSGEEVAVSKVLDDPETWHGERFHDPMEPDYPDDRIACVNLHSGGRPYLFSHTHGGRRYELCRQIEVIDAPAGCTAETTEKVLALLRRDGEFYERGGGLVIVTEGGEVQEPRTYALKHRIEGLARFERYSKRDKKKLQIDCPDEVAKRIRELNGCRGLPLLRAIGQHPTMTAEGRVIDRPGYDGASGLLLLNPDGRTWPRIPRTPTREDVLQALQTLWDPFRMFPFDGETSRSIVLASLLTAVVRRGLPTAPAFMFAAPAAGSGKTLLASGVVELAGWSAPQSLPEDEAEISKVLVSVLRRGRPAIFFDNVTGNIDSRSLNAVLTSSEYDGRVLGVSEMTGSLPTNALMVFTGNNAAPSGDACRRILVAYIDPKSETPFRREFDFNPHARVRGERMRMVEAVLTILVGWKTSGLECVARGNLASFEAWDGLIRQAVVWVGRIERCALGDAAIGFGDPTKGIEEQCKGDDETEVLGALLKAWHGACVGETFQAGDLYRLLDSARRGEYSAGELELLALALAEALPNTKSSKGLGRALRRWDRRVVGGLRLIGRHDDTTNSNQWRVEHAPIQS